MQRILIIYFLLIYPIFGFSQELAYENIDWEESPKWEALDSSYANEQEVVLKYEQIIEYTYSEKYNNNLVEYRTIHRIVKVLGDDAIQNNNKVYIGIRRNSELVEAKARVITPDNTIIDFDESNINESETEDGSANLKYFAIDGIVKGSDIEYTYTVLGGPSYSGSKKSFQDNVIQKNVSFKLIAPQNLGFAFKSYNGFPNIEKDTTNEDKNIYQVSVDSIGSLVEEDYSAYGKNLQLIIYKLDKNSGTRKSNLISFGKISQTLYTSYYSELDGPSKKKMKKFINESGVDKATSEEDKIRLIENHIKMNLGIIEGVQTKLIKDILTDGYTSENGVTHITIQALKTLGIKHELIMTCDRYDDLFDEDFEHYQVLRHQMIYFPNIDKYLAPGEQLYRLGIVPAEWTNQKGLFIKEVKVGDMVTGLGKVKFIKPLDYSLTHDNIELDVDLSDMSRPLITFKKSILGYSAVFLQAIYNLLDTEVKKELDESLIMFVDEAGEIIDYEVSGVANEDFGVNPIMYNGKIVGTTLMEKAGNRYLFKIGQMIGPQMEMYQENERILGIEHSHNMSYDRKIRFTIPDGYELSGLEALNISEQYPANDPKIIFESTYKQTGNSVEVSVVEMYKEMTFTKDEINDFRRIINAAANFNKVVLFLTKI